MLHDTRYCQMADQALSHFVQGTNTNTTTIPACPELGGSYRSVWNILGSCAVTLVICVWHAVHLDVPEPGEELVITIKKHALFVIGGFLAPEFLIGIAMEQWIRAHHDVIEFRGTSLHFLIGCG
jgi:hypothetical protein